MRVKVACDHVWVGPPDWDMHAAGDDIRARRTVRLDAGTRVVAEVICHHPYGVGVRLVAYDDHGHINPPEIRPLPRTDESDFPPVGTEIVAVVLGYSAADDQLRLTMEGAGKP